MHLRRFARTAPPSRTQWRKYFATVKQTAQGGTLYFFKSEKVRCASSFDAAAQQQPSSAGAPLCPNARGHSRATLGGPARVQTEARNLAGEIELQAGAAAQVGETKKGAFCFLVDGQSDRYELKVGNDEVREEWIDAITQAAAPPRRAGGGGGGGRCVPGIALGCEWILAHRCSLADQPACMPGLTGPKAVATPAQGWQ